ncbi:hypothetical protein DIURU_005147 [Diutina rugosa]|uniref:Peptidase A1 domain-containing protein n=1 Tax=Diutina rugosa TaxID=5481 RepID=A0A642UED7_DIURU|nr:uncharacterized protein DIURU_005147 [Diutina rugosa]KAA8897548.1 hypothetical protein DIURU_005147 [Diutina rugosa]
MVSIAYPFLISLAAALVVRDQAPKPLSFTLNKKTHPKPLKPAPLGNPSPKNSKVNDENVKLFANGPSYLINLGLIDENQQLQLVLDTGSADLWVDASKLKDTAGFTKNGEPFRIGYGDHSTVQGDFGTSSVWLDNGVEVKDLQWALGTDVELTDGIQNGILGVGKVQNEAPYRQRGQSYANFPQKLKDEGYTNSNGYSYYLNQPDKPTGTITFGGRDLAKVKGPVATITPSTTDENAPYDGIVVSKLSASNGDSFGSFGGILDTGTTLTYLPYDAINALNIPGLTYDADAQWYYITPNQPSDQYVSYWFDDAEIKVPLADLVFKEYDDNDQPTGKYWFGIQGTPDENSATLGDTFLRSAYVTVNHDTNQVLISAVNYTDKENIVGL